MHLLLLNLQIRVPSMLSPIVVVVLLAVADLNFATGQSVAQADITNIVNLHNQYRGAVSPIATNMIQIVRILLLS